MPGDLWKRLQAPSDLVSVWRGSAGRPSLRLAQARVGADVSAAGVCSLAGRTLGSGERSGSVNVSHVLVRRGRSHRSSHESILRTCAHSVVSVCIRVRAEKCEIFRWPLVRGCANVYLKWLNEAASNGSWSCRHTNLTLFHWKQWGRRERGLAPSDPITAGTKKNPTNCCDIYEKRLLAYLNFVNLCDFRMFVSEARQSGKPRVCFAVWFVCVLLMFSGTYVSIICLPRPRWLTFCYVASDFSSFNPVHYIVWTGLPDAGSEVRGWPVWHRHGWHRMQRRHPAHWNPGTNMFPFFSLLYLSVDVSFEVTV